MDCSCSAQCAPSGRLHLKPLHKVQGENPSQMMLWPFYMLFSKLCPGEFPGWGFRVFLVLFSSQERSVLLCWVNLSPESLFPISLKLSLFYCHKTLSHLSFSPLNKAAMICLHMVAIRAMMFLPVKGECQSMAAGLLAWVRGNAGHSSWGCCCTCPGSPELWPFQHTESLCKTNSETLPRHSSIIQDSTKVEGFKGFNSDNEISVQPYTRIHNDVFETLFLVGFFHILPVHIGWCNMHVKCTGK